MVFKEAIESTLETEKEVQRFMTFLKEHSYNSDMFIENDKLLKSFKEEVEIEKELKFLVFFLKTQKEIVAEEVKVFKKKLASDCLKAKCNMIDKSIQLESHEDEDYGDDE